MKLSRRLNTLKPPATTAMSNRAKDLCRQGKDVLVFAAGEPDFDTPRAIKDAAIQALLDGQTKYMPTLGDRETREVIAAKFTKENGLPDMTWENVGVSAGGKHALFVALHCLIDPPTDGEQPPEVILPVPAWISYAPMSEMAGAKVIELVTTPEADYKISPAQLRAAITPRSRVLIINSPSNPCSTMYSEAELRALAAVVLDAAKSTAPDLMVFSDEMYEKIVYGGIPHFSIGSIPEMAARTITFNGLSKAFAMTGWRIGYAGASGDWGRKFMKAMLTLQGQMTTNITSFVYPAIRTALTQCADEVERMRKAFGNRAQLVTKLMAGIPGLKCPRPTGAFYAFPDVSAHFGKRTKGGRVLKCGMDFAEALLDEALIATVPGEEFGSCGAKCIRLSFACSEEQIEKGMARLGEFVAGLK